MQITNPYIAMLRLSHWSKAAFVFIGLIYSENIPVMGSAFAAALAFCLVASSVYIYNDFQDREEDRYHPVKRNRPIASRVVSLEGTLILFLALLGIGFLLAWMISDTLVFILGLYLFINVIYNHLLKVLPVLDVLCIASGFLLRVLAGTVGIGISISHWLIIAATLLSFLIALAKRRMEKSLNLQQDTRAVLARYSLEMLDELIVASALACFMTYLFYVVYVHESSFYFMLTLPFAAIGLSRFIVLIAREASNDDPIDVLFSDTLSKINMICFIGLTILALY